MVGFGAGGGILGSGETVLATGFDDAADDDCVGGGC